MTVATFFLKADQAERRLCVLANAAARRRLLRGLFRAVSRLGDGIFWYLLMAAMPLLLGGSGFAVAARMLIAGAAGLALYKLLKRKLVRERPFVGLVGIDCAMPPLDRYSFPSGHTLHAVLFTTMAVQAAPVLALLLVPFTLLVAASRVVLGLHYPSDVLAGATLGFAIASVANTLA
ncbi:MAG: phosphatase PAP2 family protein [Steroidobacteraceae bacterium]